VKKKEKETEKNRLPRALDMGGGKGSNQKVSNPGGTGGEEGLLKGSTELERQKLKRRLSKRLDESETRTKNPAKELRKLRKVQKILKFEGERRNEKEKAGSTVHNYGGGRGRVRVEQQGCQKWLLPV